MTGNNIDAILKYLDNLPLNWQATHMACPHPVLLSSSLTPATDIVCEEIEIPELHLACGCTNNGKR